MRFGILGAVEVRRADGEAVPIGGTRVRALLALLLLNPGRLVTTEGLIDGLYGEDPPGNAANALQSQVSRLRRALEDIAIEFHPAGYRLAIDPEIVDVHRFTRLAAEGRQALDAGDPHRAASLLDEALGLWRGPALADLAEEPFAAAQATRLETARITAVEDHAEADLLLGRHHEVVARLQELVAAHPLRERPRGQLMRALYGDGRQAEALAVYEDLRQVLADELGADPSPEISAVHLAVLRADPSLAPAERKTNLPAQLSSFVGREEEIARSGTLLADRRLVTLLGPGGAGKTRLAIESGRRQADVIDTCFVDLAPLTSGGEVAQAALSALGVRETGVLQAGAPGKSPDAAQRLIEALHGRRMLLIFDNCEHVVAHTARLVHDLLSACPDLRVLATSREALGITGEALCPLPPLALPPEGATADEAPRYPAVELFADRAAAVRPGFAVTEDNLAAVLQICRALDGLPLAIELAAARLRSLTVAEVAARLDDRFRLLSRGDRTAAPRHQTLRAVVEWSWDLLSAREQTLARRLTVFNGGVTLPVAAQVCGIDTGEADELLADLADKSLVERAGERYRMLDTIQVFCAERLAEAGEDERFHRAHLAYFLDLAERADPFLRRAEQVEWLERLTAEHGNLHGALRWAVRHDTAGGLRLLGYLSWYWWMRGLRSEGAPLAAELLAATGPEPPEGLEEQYMLCLLDVAHGEVLGERQQLVDRATAITIGMNRYPSLPFTALIWAMAVGPDPGEDVAEAMARFWPADPWSLSLYKLGEGLRHYLNGDLGTAEDRLQAALTEFDELGDRWGMTQALDTLSILAGWRGDQDRSRLLLGRAIELVTELNSLEDMADLSCRRGDTLATAGDAEAARADYERGADLARRIGKPATQAWAHNGLAELAWRAGEAAEARRLFEVALSETEGVWFFGSEPRARALVGLGRLAEAEGDLTAARRLCRDAVTVAMTHRNLPAAAYAIDGLASAAARAGDGVRAALLLGAAVAVRGGAVVGDAGVAKVTATAGELVGDGAYATAYRTGAALTPDEALALALAND